MKQSRNLDVTEHKGYDNYLFLGRRCTERRNEVGWKSRYFQWVLLTTQRYCTVCVFYPLCASTASLPPRKLLSKLSRNYPELLSLGQVLDSRLVFCLPLMPVIYAELRLLIIR